jgi:hypothetical protein
MIFEVSPKFTTLNDEIEIKIQPHGEKVPDSIMCQIKVGGNNYF